jgi:RNA recognition motif-containing protein
MIRNPMVGNGLQDSVDRRTYHMSNSKLYVGNLSFKSTEEDVRAVFEQFGAVTDVFIAMDKMTGRPRGFAFVTMGTAEEAKVAAEKLNGHELDGRVLTVNEARPKEEGGRGGFGGGAPRGERRGGFGGGERRGGGGGGFGGGERRGGGGGFGDRRGGGGRY